MSNRQRCCYLNRARSKMREINVGVPQGSCLGPLLFLICINDLLLVLKHATPSIFADDTQMATSPLKISELQNQLAEDIENVIQWMSLNVLKTDFIIVGTRSKLRDLEETLCITVQIESIYRAPFVKFLGFFTDENLDWGDNVSHVLKKVSSGLSILKMSKNYLPQRTLRILYNFLIETHFRYGNIIWGNCGETFLTRLQKLQKRAARIITGSDYDTPAEPLIEPLGWKTVGELIQNDTSVMMYKSMNNGHWPLHTSVISSHVHPNTTHGIYEALMSIYDPHLWRQIRASEVFLTEGPLSGIVWGKIYKQLLHYSHLRTIFSICELYLGSSLLVLLGRRHTISCLSRYNSSALGS